MDNKELNLLLEMNYQKGLFEGMVRAFQLMKDGAGNPMENQEPVIEPETKNDAVVETQEIKNEKGKRS